MASKKERRRITERFFSTDLPTWYNDICAGNSILGTHIHPNLMNTIRLDNIMRDEMSYGIDQDLMYVGPYSCQYTDESNRITEIGLCTKQLAILSDREYDEPDQPMLYTVVTHPMFVDWCYERDINITSRTVENDMLNRKYYTYNNHWCGARFIKLTYREARKYINWAIKQLRNPLYAYRYSKDNINLRWDKSIVYQDGDRFPFLAKAVSRITQITKLQCIGLYGAVGATSWDRAFNKKAVLTVLNRHIHRNMRCVNKSYIFRVVFDAECGPDKNIKTHVVLLKGNDSINISHMVSSIIKRMASDTICKLKTIALYNVDGTRAVLFDATVIPIK